MKKILLLHGWDWKNYPKFNSRDPWENRGGLVRALAKKLVVHNPSLPGFGNSHIPSSPWTIENYTEWLSAEVAATNYDAILGYSFGGAVLAHWASSSFIAKPQSALPLLFLVSPAIIRRYEVSRPSFPSVRKYLKNKFPKAFWWIRDFYLSKWIKNPYYSHGDYFQKNSYLNIVGLDSSQDLRVILAHTTGVQLIYGSNDTATPPDLIRNALPESAPHIIEIKDGDHDIGTTHIAQICEAIFEIMNIN